MNLDLGLIAVCIKAIKAKPRKKVTVSDAIAVALQESHGVPWFIPTEIQFKQNLRTAVLQTKTHESRIRQLIVIPDSVGAWKTPEQMAGKFAKFRFERGYFNQMPTSMPFEDRFYKSCSWGLGQLMGAHLKDAQEIKRFMSDVNLQALWLVGMLDELLTKTGGSLVQAYAGYNSGDTNCQNPVVIKRATNVSAMQIQVEEELKRRGLI